jgi:dephospho-CoA kinase
LKIESNIIRHYLKNVYFITGTAYAGKSTAVRMLAERYDMIGCGENYHSVVSDIVATPDAQPNISWLNNLTDWKDFVTRAPEEYERWIYATAREAAEFEVAQLISMPRDRKIIVDTNIPVDILREISDYKHVAVMLSPQSMSVDRFFDRNDPDKQFILSVIDSCDDKDAVMDNYRRGLKLINSQKHYDEYANSGFFTVVRQDNDTDTREDVCNILAEHFGLTMAQRRNNDY